MSGGWFYFFFKIFFLSPCTESKVYSQKCSFWSINIFEYNQWFKEKNIDKRKCLQNGFILNKRAQRALGRSPEEKVKGHSGANNRESQGVEDLLMMLYIKYESTGPCGFRQEDFWKFHFETYLLTPWPTYATNRNGVNNFDRGPPRDHSCEVWSNPISGLKEDVVWSFPYINQCKIVTPGAGSIFTPGPLF